MILQNGTNIGEYDIVTSSKEHFNEVFSKLRALGFVYANIRCKTIKEIDKEYGYYSVINIGRDSTCRMVLHGRAWVKESSQTVTVDEFIANHFRSYYNA